MNRTGVTQHLIGEVKLMRGFQVCVCRLLVILQLTAAATSLQGAEDSRPELTKWIDQRFEEHYRSTAKEMPDVVDGATFLRRVYLDLAGRIPTIAQLRDFTADSNPGKRLKIVDELLASERFSDHTARVWRRILMPPSTTPNTIFASSVDRWLKEQFGQNTPYDEMARRLVIAGGAELQASTGKDDKSAVDNTAEFTATRASNSMAAPTAYLQHTGGLAANMASSVSRVVIR